MAHFRKLWLAGALVLAAPTAAMAMDLTVDCAPTAKACDGAVDCYPGPLDPTGDHPPPLPQPDPDPDPQPHPDPYPHHEPAFQP